MQFPNSRGIFVHYNLAQDLKNFDYDTAFIQEHVQVDMLANLLIIHYLYLKYT